KCAAKNWPTSNMSVNEITPAAARRAIFEQITQGHIDFMLSRIPRGRFVEVDEIATMIAFMVSEEKSFTTGFPFDISGARATYGPGDRAVAAVLPQSDTAARLRGVG